MAMYDWNGTTSSELGKAYDWDGTTSHQLGKGYDWDGTTNNLIYSAETLLYNRGTGYEGFAPTNVSNSCSSTVSAGPSSITMWTGNSYGNAKGSVCVSFGLFDLSVIDTITVIAKTVDNVNLTMTVMSDLTTQYGGNNSRNFKSVVKSVGVSRTNSEQTVTIDVSDLTGSYYIGCQTLSQYYQSGNPTGNSYVYYVLLT